MTPIYSLEVVNVTLKNSVDYIVTVFRANDGFHVEFINEQTSFSAVNKDPVKAIGYCVMCLEGDHDIYYCEDIGSQIYEKLLRVDIGVYKKLERAKN